MTQETEEAHRGPRRPQDDTPKEPRRPGEPGYKGGTWESHVQTSMFSGEGSQCSTADFTPCVPDNRRTSIFILMWRS